MIQNCIHELNSSLLKSSVFLNQLLLPEAWKADRQLRRLACAFAPQHEAAPVLGVSNV